MKYFENFVSNSIAGSGSQKTFSMQNGETRVSRVYYKIACGGTFDYSFLYTNVIDSTFADGSECHKNYVCDEWELLSLRAAVTNGCSPDEPFINAIELTFDGKKTKTVHPAEFFTSDPARLTVNEHQYLCLELTFSGNVLPYHPEIQIPVFIKNGKTWIDGKETPVPSMIGCKRAVKKRVGFLGDSITQGCGVPFNSYEHYTAHVSKAIGREYSFWNLGLGYARADDMASLGAWFYKAKQLDVACVCFGVNDIGRGFSAQTIKKNLTVIVDELNKAGIRVLIQSIPRSIITKKKRLFGTT